MRYRTRTAMSRTPLGVLTAVLLAGALVLSPQAASALPLGSLGSATPESATETSVAVAVPVTAERSVYLLGQAAPVSATVRVHGAEGEGLVAPLGTVEFFDGEVLLGAADVVADGTAGRAEIDTDRWPAGGARDVTASFVPAEGSGLTPSTSPPQTYRVVDTTRIVPDVDLAGEAEAEIGDASLEWTIANIWFSNFRVGFEREALEGPVTLPDIPHPGAGASDDQLHEYYFRPFTFSQGRGERDSDGNRVISFEGSARLTSGSGNQWNFTDPQVRIAPNGDGYITAEFDGFYSAGSALQNYGPVRVTIATFSGAGIEGAEAGARGDRRVEATIPLNWEGQAGGEGTWFYDYDDSFPNEFVALLNPLVAPFFVRSAVATDASKAPHPIALSFTESVLEDEGPGAEEPGPDEPGTEEPEPDDPGKEPGTEGPGGGEPSADEENPGGPQPDEPTPKAWESTDRRSGWLAVTGGPSSGLLSALGAFGVIALLGGSALLARRRHRPE